MTTGPDNLVYYGGHNEGEDVGFRHIFTHRVGVRMSGVEKIVTLRLRARRDDDPESPYWGWLETGETYYSMVQPSRVHLDMCFPYGIEAAVRAGQGEAVNLIVQRWEEESTQ